jgi:hypothetical protein
MYYLWCRYCEVAKCPVGAVKDVYRRPAQRWGAKEDLTAFLARIESEYADPKNWDQRDKTVGYFVRYELRLLISEINHWKTTRLDPIMADIRAWVEGKAPHYANDGNLINKYGRCGLFDGLVKQDFSSYRKRERPFPELSTT